MFIPPSRIFTAPYIRNTRLHKKGTERNREKSELYLCIRVRRCLRGRNSEKFLVTWRRQIYNRSTSSSDLPLLLSTRKAETVPPFPKQTTPAKYANNTNSQSLKSLIVAHQNQKTKQPNTPPFAFVLTNSAGPRRQKRSMFTEMKEEKRFRQGKGLTGVFGLLSMPILRCVLRMGGGSKVQARGCTALVFYACIAVRPAYGWQKQVSK
ncbi:uncharacterized protein LOC121051729 [Rosa chinensis]|uniref:uncharacterized protein LOC121051729 n=1 Tax=Rosa chinensis TaxID=74649 RepID=UPI001AD92A42|nr:uncharacterized protein LOC121051729 [Rosa chinensis]